MHLEHQLPSESASPREDGSVISRQREEGAFTGPGLFARHP